MGNPRRFVAIDLGASSGRVLVGRWDGARFDMSEAHRFANGPVSTMGHLHWDVLSIWAEIKSGLACCIAGETRADGLAGLGLDTWGVDFALLDRDGKLLGNPYHYRDRRNDGTMELAFERVPRAAIYDTTGIQTMPINTVFQLLEHGPRRRSAARGGEDSAAHAQPVRLLALGAEGRRVHDCHHHSVPGGSRPPLGRRAHGQARHSDSDLPPDR